MNISALYFPSAIALGALHALEPGHAKTLTAAYLIGTKGTRRDAVVLGLSVATTHSIVVIGLAAGALYLGREAFTDAATYWLQVGSGTLVIILGAWLLWRRWPRQRKACACAHGHSHAHHHGHEHVHNHHHASEPFVFQSEFGSGTLAIVNTEEGERFRLTYADSVSVPLEATARILRPHNQVEHHSLVQDPASPVVWMSQEAPQEPHEFDALLELVHDGRRVELPFQMREPTNHHHHAHGHKHDHSHHHHDHDDLDEDAHARAHAATLPDYVHRGERPSFRQIMTFGAAGGLIPCPAAVTVMLLAVSIGRAANGLLLVLGFSLGLAITLVGIGLAVVAGLKALGSTGRFGWLSRNAALVSAGVVMLSGAASLLVATLGSHHVD